MNRAQRRASAANGRHIMAKQYWSPFDCIPGPEWPPSAMNQPQLVSVHKNSRYVVQTYRPIETAWGWFKKVAIRRNDASPVHSWSEIQRIKNEIFGKEMVAIEFYPAESKLVDVANVYWIWVFHSIKLPEEFKI